jgi:cytochrome c-type biogenesis protein CcmF
MGLMMLALGVGVLVRWKDTPLQWLGGMLLPVLVASGALGLLGAWLFGDFHWAVLAVCLLAAWVVLAGVRDLLDKTRHKGLLKGLAGLSRSYWGMQVAHFGIAVTALGIVLSSQYSLERDLRMAPGDAVDLGGYQFRFDGAKPHKGPNYTAHRGSVQVLKDGREVTVLHPEKRMYTVQSMPMTEAGIDAGFTRDLYVALGEPLEDGAWAVRLHVKPFVRWIWLGGLLMALGGFLAALDRRYRVKVTTKVREALGMTGVQA